MGTLFYKTNFDDIDIKQVDLKRNRRIEISFPTELQAIRNTYRLTLLALALTFLYFQPFRTQIRTFKTTLKHKTNRQQSDITSYKHRVTANVQCTKLEQ